MNGATPPPRGCVLIPAYREAGRVGAVIAGARRYVGRVIVVDDGSPDDTAREAAAAGADVIAHDRNRGKGAALETGFQRARALDCEFVITMDGDGQHAPEDIERFLDAYRRTGLGVLVGNRMDHCAGMPFVRWLTNVYTSWVLSRRMGQRVPDTQCGFRLYRCDILDGVACASDRFDAESEILLALAARGARIGAVPIRMIYGDEKSKIHPLRDTYRFFRMLRRFGRGAAGAQHNRCP